MLDSFRNIAKTWFGKLLGAFLIVGLAGFGISNVIFDIGSNTVARVGEEEITTREFQRAYSNQLNRFAQQVGRVPTAQEAVAVGIPSMAINRLASEAAINQLGARLGIGVSDDRLGKMLREDPSFSGTLGQFDRTSFLRVLQQNGFTEAEYFNLQTKTARRQQLVSGLFGGSVAPQAAQELMARYGGDTRTIDYFAVNAQAIAPIAEPTEEELAAYVAEHQDQFRTAETRTVELLVLSPETLAAIKTIGEEDIAAEYERTKASRMRIERRQIRQAPLATEAQQGWFERGKAAGRSFEELVAETGLTVTELGMLEKARITDPQLAEAAFALAEGDFVVIQGVGGKRAITVSAIEPGGAITLDEAREEIRQSLALAQARSEYVDILDQVEELRATFQPLAQIAERFGFPLRPATLTASGAELAQVSEVPPADQPRVALAIFAGQQDRLAPTVSLGANRSVWFEIKGIEPARDQTLDEIRDQVAEAWTADMSEAAVLAEVEKIVERLKAGEAFGDVAMSLNQFPNLSQPLSRSGDGSTVLNQDVAAAVFAGGPDHFGSARDGDGDHVVFQVVEVTPAGEESFAAMRSFIEDASRETLYADFVNGLRDEAGIRINRQTFDQLIALDATTGQ
ncbi:MAG: SurA N-terminal domain-containing protein [Devosia sp.]|nr:SurA N-terminal domain-containing protein [Devosia sp.]